MIILYKYKVRQINNGKNFIVFWHSDPPPTFFAKIYNSDFTVNKSMFALTTDGYRTYFFEGKLILNLINNYNCKSCCT